MIEDAILTIGYGNRTIAEFLELLKNHQVQFLVDVRSHPYSKFNPPFSGDVLQEHLKKANIQYIFMGNTIGGKPSGKEHFTEDGYIDYQKLAKMPAYQKGIKRLLVARERRLRMVLMCSETRPEDCHRSKLIGETLESLGVPALHIDVDGLLVKQKDVIARLLKGQDTLFGTVLKSRKKYLVEETDEN